MRPPTSPRTPDCRPGTGSENVPPPDVLALAAKGRAFRSLDTLTIRPGGHHLLYGSALALAAATLAWARHTDTTSTDLAAAVIR
jgi:hypothetical protein